VNAKAETTLSAERHNAAIRPVLAFIVSLVGSNPVDLLVFTETIVVGLFMLIVKLGGDEPTLEVFTEGLRERLAQSRLRDLDAGPLQ
jgi:hypothetical protein